MKLFIKQILFFYLVFIVISTSFSQKKEDGKNKKIAHIKNDNYIDSIVILSKDFYKKDYDSSLFYSTLAIKLSKQKKYTKGLGDAYYWKSKVFYKQQNYNLSIKNAFTSIVYRKEINDTVGLAKSYSTAGLSYFNKNNFDSALICQENCLEQYLKTDRKKSIAIAYNNIGSAQINIGNYKDAILEFQKAMKLFEEIEMKQGVASCLLNIGQIYDLMGNAKDTTQNNKALDYYKKALYIFMEGKDDFNIAQTYNAIGIEYDQKATIYGEIAQKRDSINGVNTLLQRDLYYREAIQYLSKGLNIFQKIEYPLGIAQVTNNIGTIYMNQDRFDIALKYLNKALKANRISQNAKEISTNYLSIAKCYRKMRKYELALETLNKGFDNVEELRIPNLFQNYYEEYSIINQYLNNFEDAYNYHLLYTEIKDSLLKADNLTTINEVQALYKNEIKDKELLLSEEQLSKEKAVSQKKQMQIYGFAVFAILLIGLAFFILRSLRQKKRSNKILADKNEYITHQQNETTDSITYASRIQTAVLPQENYTDKIFNEHFILFKPQHIVSGDFFWVKNIEDKDVVIATAADCTGHGVPGAFMSMLGLSFLNEISNKHEFNSTAKILNELRKIVINSLHQTGKSGEQKDGMDISLIAWYKKENYIEFSGANNPLYLIRDGELIEFKGDKMPIGIHVKDDDFTSKKIPIIKGDCFYMFSDGYADQFGGPKGKKFKYKPFKKILIENAHLPMIIQKQILDKNIEEWKAFINPYDNKPYEQIDDIVVFGIRF